MKNARNKNSKDEGEAENKSARLQTGFVIRTKNLDGIKLVIIVTDVCLIQHCIIDFVSLWFMRSADGKSV